MITGTAVEVDVDPSSVSATTMVVLVWDTFVLFALLTEVEVVVGDPLSSVFNPFLGC